MLICDLEAAIRLLKQAYKDRLKTNKQLAEITNDSRARKTTAYARHETNCEYYNRCEKALITLCEKIAAGDCIRLE